MKTQIKAQPLETIKPINRQKIVPFLWFNNQAEEAAHFYCSVFKNARVKTTAKYNDDSASVSGMPKGSVMTVAFELEGQEFVGLNGGPMYKISPAISFMVHCRTHEKIDELWNRLLDGGYPLMELGKYPFSEKYGWVQDKFGISWQLIYSDNRQIISPCLMFTAGQHGRAEEAINNYMSVFPNSAVERIVHYESGEEGPTGAVKYASFSLNGQHFSAMDSGVEVPFSFTPAVSFVVNCENQQEIDYFWENLTRDGDEKAQQCGWLKDKYDVSWQVIPRTLAYMLSDSDSETARQITQALMKMRKIDYNELKCMFEVHVQKEAQIDFAETGTNYQGIKKDTLTPNEEL